MEKDPFVMSRSYFCQSCYDRGKPLKGDLFVVYKHDHDCLAIKVNHRIAVRGYTPFLFSWEEPMEIADGKVDIIACCGNNNCGVEVNFKQYQKAGQDEVVDIKFIKTTHLFLPVEQFVALRSKWRDTGYELF